MNHSQDTTIKSPPSPFTGKRQARILAVQCLYNIALTPENVKPANHIIADILAYGADNSEELDQQYFLSLIKSAYNNISSLHKNLQKYLAKGWKVSRLPEPIQAILVLAAYEIIYNFEVPVRILINEYIEITKIFNHPGEAGFVNSILDKISKEFPREQ
ncbi:MAG: transcription antitermination factor NusB [Candidatus Midichloria sp.]|uniref:Transcription antitermination factor NusB n=1 Tax=Hyalomma marginatum TaxID=34627 RepID=A0A8S4BVE4_9ACAR|nr:transcription antitermination factor NusB [Hyalomma marginatum]CAG7590311.1 transcription antitermination factor NusB [Hyalomma marginatum]